MERSEPTSVLPIVSTSHAHLAAHVNLRRNKMMLPKYYHLKALGGSSTNSPRETLSSQPRSVTKALGGSSANSPRETLSSQLRSFTKELGGSSTKLPPERRYRRNRD